MNMTKRIEALERQCPDDQLSFEGRISQAALAKLTDEELEAMLRVQEKSKLGANYLPTDEEADAMLTYVHHIDAECIEEGKAKHASKS